MSTSFCHNVAVWGWGGVGGWWCHHALPFGEVEVFSVNVSWQAGCLTEATYKTICCVMVTLSETISISAGWKKRNCLKQITGRVETKIRVPQFDSTCSCQNIMPDQHLKYHIWTKVWRHKSAAVQWNLKSNPIQSWVQDNFSSILILPIRNYENKTLHIHPTEMFNIHFSPPQRSTYITPALDVSDYHAERVPGLFISRWQKGAWPICRCGWGNNSLIYILEDQIKCWMAFTWATQMSSLF